MPVNLSSLGAKSMKRLTLTSGSSWTVPSGVTFVNVTLIGGGGGGAASESSSISNGLRANGGQIIHSTLSTTPGSSISYTIGAGGAGSATIASGNTGSVGVTTTFTGATSALGGNPSGGPAVAGANGTPVLSAENGGQCGGGNTFAGGNGGAGGIIVEYWT
jgi:hypothetical protein